MRFACSTCWPLLLGPLPIDGRVRIISDGVRTRIPCNSTLLPPTAVRPMVGASSFSTAASSSTNCIDDGFVAAVVVISVDDEDELKQQLIGAIESATVATATGGARWPPFSDGLAHPANCSLEPLDELDGDGSSAPDGPGDAAAEEDDDDDDEMLRCCVGVAASPVDCKAGGQTGKAKGKTNATRHRQGKETDTRRQVKSDV